MFVFLPEEIVTIAHENELSQFLSDMENCGELSKEDKKFIGFFNLQNPYKDNKTEVQRYEYLTLLNEALIKRRDLPAYSFW